MRVYTGVFEAVSISAAQDLFELAAPSGMALRILRIEIGQSASTTSIDSIIRLRRGVGSTTGSGGSTVTPGKAMTGDPSSSATLKANNTTPMTGGTIVTLAARAWNILTPWIYAPTPEEVLTLAPSERLVVNLPNSLTITGYGEIIYGEVG